MTPQFQRYLVPGQGASGDCYRTCLAMILNMDRDAVPHFNAELPKATPSNDERSLACEAAERAWLAGHGLTTIQFPTSGEVPLQDLLQDLKRFARAPIILTCSIGSHVNHAVVVHEGEIYDPLPLFGERTYMPGFDTDHWWITVLAPHHNWMTRDASRQQAFQAGWHMCADAANSDGISVPMTRKAAYDKWQGNLHSPAPTATVLARRKHDGVHNCK